MDTILIIVRYSVISDSQAWVASRGDKGKYVSQIMEPSRLELREQLFNTFALSSIAGQESFDSRVVLLVLVSDLLPTGYLQRLRKVAEKALLTSSVELRIELVSSGGVGSAKTGYKNINEAAKSTISDLYVPSGKITTVRLDDDDALSCDYIRRLEMSAKDCSVGTLVSFSYGVEGAFENGIVIDLKHLYFPKNAQGLAYINRYASSGDVEEGYTIHVYNTGNHTTVDERYPVLIDARRPSFFRTVNVGNDSGGTSHRKMLLDAPKELLDASFPFLGALVSPDLPPGVDYKKTSVSKFSTPWVALINVLNKNLDRYRKNRAS